MINRLNNELTEKNLSNFNRLLLEAEKFDENEMNQEEELDKEDTDIIEDDVFSKVKQANEDSVETNAYSFLGREVDGSYSALNDITNEKDPAIKGLCTVITGSIVKNSEDSVGYITTLFDIVGLNDISEEDFNNVKGTIWKKLEDLTALDPAEAYSSFSKFVNSLINGIRNNK